MAKATVHEVPSSPLTSLARFAVYPLPLARSTERGKQRLRRGDKSSSWGTTPFWPALHATLIDHKSANSSLHNPKKFGLSPPLAIAEDDGQCLVPTQRGTWMCKVLGLASTANKHSLGNRIRRCLWHQEVQAGTKAPAEISMHDDATRTFRMVPNGSSAISREKRRPRYSPCGRRQLQIRILPCKLIERQCAHLVFKSWSRGSRITLLLLKWPWRCCAGTARQRRGCSFNRLSCTAHLWEQRGCKPIWWALRASSGTGQPPTRQFKTDWRRARTKLAACFAEISVLVASSNGVAASTNARSAPEVASSNGARTPGSKSEER